MQFPSISCDRALLLDRQDGDPLLYVLYLFQPMLPKIDSRTMNMIESVLNSAELHGKIEYDNA